MDSQGAAAAFCQHGEIAAGLRGFYYAERVLLAWHREIHFVVTGDLQEDAGIGAAFVRLAGGVEKTRPEAEDGGNLFCVADRVTNALERGFVLIVHGDVAENAEVIASIDAVEMGFYDVAKCGSAL